MSSVIKIQSEQIHFKNCSGTTTGVNQLVVAANKQRRGIMIQNISDTDMYISFGVAATAGAGSFLLPKNGGMWTSPPHGVPVGALNLICASASKAFTAKEW